MIGVRVGVVECPATFHIDLRALGPYMAPDGRPGRGLFFFIIGPQTEPLSLSSLRASSDPRDRCSAA